MTDLDLQKELANELRDHLLDDGIMMVRGKEFKDINVFKQDLPIKSDGDEDEDDDKIWNYIIVMIGDEDVVDGEWKVEIHFLIGIEDKDLQCQGNMNIAYIMNEIYMHLRKETFTGNRKEYEMEEEAHKRFNLNADYPYYEGDLITYWKLPLPLNQGLEEFL